MFCDYPFDMLHVGERSYMTCCRGWFKNPPQFVVSGDYDNLWDVWNHEKFKNLRRLWLDGKIQGEYPQECSPCGKRVELGLQDTRLEHHNEVMKKGPKIVNFSNDLTCNLHCWTCRSRPIIQKKQERVWKQTNNVLQTWKDDIRLIECIGSGDPLASPAWLDILKNINPLDYNDNFRIRLFTNGLLIPTHWSKISNIHNTIETIKMSIDAVTKDIYERTRLGGKWEDLNRALDFICDIGKPLILNMVVTADNFTDIPLLIKKALSIPNCYRVNISTMRYWFQMRGGYEAFHEMDLTREDHPKRESFINLLNDNKELLSNPIVFAERIMPKNHKELVRNPSMEKKRKQNENKRI